MDHALTVDAAAEPLARALGPWTRGRGVGSLGVWQEGEDRKASGLWGLKFKVYGVWKESFVALALLPLLKANLLAPACAAVPEDGAEQSEKLVPAIQASRDQREVLKSLSLRTASAWWLQLGSQAFYHKSAKVRAFPMPETLRDPHGPSRLPAVVGRERCRCAPEHCRRLWRSFRRRRMEKAGTGHETQGEGGARSLRRQLLAQVHRKGSV